MFDADMMASRDATAAAVEGCDIDHVCMPISVKSSLQGFNYFRFSVNEARRNGRVSDIARLASNAGRQRHASTDNPWVVLATSPVFVFADLRPAAGRDLDLGSPFRVVDHTASTDGRAVFLRALAAQAGNTFLVHSTSK
jgi:hypothetical protein